MNHFLFSFFPSSTSRLASHNVDWALGQFAYLFFEKKNAKPAHENAEPALYHAGRMIEVEKINGTLLNVNSIRRSIMPFLSLYCFTATPQLVTCATILEGSNVKNGLQTSSREFGWTLKSNIPAPNRPAHLEQKNILP